MLGYFLKRLLLILPTVWLIGSLVFLLSRIIPGSHRDVKAEAEMSTVGSGSFNLTRERYLKQLQESGEDKPLFYFSVRNRAQPDTLHLVFPEQDQTLLQDLLNRNGNWPAVAAYYQSLIQLQAATTMPEDSTTPVWEENVSLLLQNADPAIISHALADLTAHTTIYKQKVVAVQERFTQMQQQAKPLNLLIPRIAWHGGHNQYHQWLWHWLQGNLGNSIRFKEPVTKVIKEAIGNTLPLITSSLILTFALSIKLALALCNWRKGQSSVLNSLYVLDSTPLFILALLLFTYLAGPNYLGLFPASGLGDEDPSGNWLEWVLNRLWHLVLPTMCLLLTSLPYVTTQLYQALQQVLHQQFIVTARAKGLPEEQVLRWHAFRNALLPLITLFTGNLPAIIAGVLVVEYIFSIHGTGKLLVDSVMGRDYPVIIGLVLLVATIQALAHLLADYLYFLADPRTRLKSA